MCMYAYVHTCMCACMGTLLCLQILLHPPALPSWSRRSPNLKNSIKCERIEIFEFCLKICDPWALLHTYRLGLMCTWGGVPSEMAFLCFEPKKVHVFHSCQRTVNHGKIWNVPLDALICPLQITNRHWTPIIDPSWRKRDLYPLPVQCRKLLERP